MVPEPIQQLDDEQLRLIAYRVPEASETIQPLTCYLAGDDGIAVRPALPGLEPLLREAWTERDIALPF
jgi:hypothetical protein